MKTKFKIMKVRIPEHMDELIRQSVAQEGFQSINAWMVNAFSNQLRYEPNAIQDFEARLVDEFERRRFEQATIAAMLDSFVRLFLLFIPDPDVTSEREAEAYRRYKRYLERTAKTIQSGSVKFMAVGADGQAEG